MKHARKALIFMILLVTPLLLSGVISPAPNDEVKTALPQTPTKVSLPSYEITPAIIVYNNSEMDGYASALSWEGNGEPDTPYIIEGYNITTDGDCIEIQNTSRAFEIRNCYLTSSSGNHGGGIIIYNATQVAIVDTIVEGKSDAITIGYTPSPYIENCTIHGGVVGINMAVCPGATIHGSYISELFDHAIIFIECNNTLISDNDIHSTIVGSGIQFHLSHYVTVVNNHISYCQASGIQAWYSPYATIENNIIHDNDYNAAPVCGIFLNNAAHTSIVGNEIYNNRRNGIYAQESDWLYVFDNEIYNNSDHGIDVIFSANGTILQNDIHGNGWWPFMTNALCGIYLGPTADMVISDNSIWNNTPSGISIEGGDRITISTNHIFNNTDTGIWAYGGPSHHLYIIGNEVHHNGLLDLDPNDPGGIILEGYYNSSINLNRVYNNSYQGITFFGDYNEVIGNVVHDSETGISAIECYNNIVSDNIVFNCLGGIYVVNVGTNVTHNVVYDNIYGILMDWSGDCFIYGNDLGWNEINAFERNTFGGQPLLWHDNVSMGNWYHDYNYTGFYNISSDTGHENVDWFPSNSLNLTQAVPVSFEILETGNLIEWEAYALNPSHYEVFVDGASVLVEDWDGGNIEYLADGLSHGTHTIDVTVFHISGHFLGNDTTAGVEDLTPPVVDGPIVIEITVGEALNVQYTATDPSGILSWTVNDTLTFEFSSTGILSNIVDLEVGNYTLLLEIADPHGNAHHMFVTVIVTAAPGGGLPTTLLLAIGAGAGIVVLVIVIIGYKTKKG